MQYFENTSKGVTFVSQDGSIKVQQVSFLSDSYIESFASDFSVGASTVVLSTDLDFSHSSLLRVGIDVDVCFNDKHESLESMYVSPFGHSFFVSSYGRDGCDSLRDVVSRFIVYAKEIQSWNHVKINSIAEDYFYKNEGQAFSAIDAMVRSGYLSFSDESKFNHSIDSNFKSSSFLLIVFDNNMKIKQFVISLNI